jgi:CHAD domain-containing protein
MKETLEHELKLSVKRGFELPPLAADVVPKHLRATYHDTDDHRLARHGVTLRRRNDDGRDLWQLKLPSDGDRLEIESEANGPDVPLELQSLLTAYLRGSVLRPIAELHTLRRAVRVTDGHGPAAEVVHDSVRVLDGDRVVREFDEVEVEQLSQGSARLIARLERQLRAAGAKTSDGRPKVFQALDLPATVGPRARRGAPPVEHLRAFLHRQFESLLLGDPATRRGDSAGVHRMRVATRRLRSALKEAQRMLETSWVDETRAELKWLGEVLGDVRDADVFAAYVKKEAEQLGADAVHGGTDLGNLMAERSVPARARLAEALDSPRYLALLDRLEAIRESLPVTPARDSPERMLRRATRRTLRNLRGVGRTSSDGDLHALRIAAKRSRYAGELAQSTRSRAAALLTKRATDLQEVLGEHQDAVVAEARLGSLVEGATPAAAFVAGRLFGLQRERREAARAALPKAVRQFRRAARRA